MNIFVGNLSFQTTERELQHLFEEYGQVKSTKVVTDNYTKRSRGFAFVEMAERAAGEKAVEKLNNTSLDNRSIVVNEARENDRRTSNNSERRFEKRY